MAAVGASSGGQSAGGIRAGLAYVELIAKDRISPVLDKLNKKMSGLGSALTKGGGAALAAGTAVLAPVTALLTAGVERFDEMAKEATRLNVPIEQYSRLANAAEIAGVSVEELAKNSGKYADVIAAAPTSSAEAIAAAVEASREWRATLIALKDAGAGLMTDLLPLFKVVTGFVRENAGTVKVVAAVGAALVALGVAGVAAGAALSGAAVVVGVLKAALLAVVSSTGLAALAVGGLGYLFVTQTDAGREFSSEVSAGLRNVADTAVTAGAGIRDALAVGDIAGAWKVALAGLKAVWADLVAWMTGKWGGFKAYFVDAWHDGAKLFKLALNDIEFVFGEVFTRILKWFNTEFGGAMRRVFGVAASALDALGDKGTASALRTIASASVDQVNRALDAGISAAGRRHTAEENRIEREASDAQAARDRARLNDLNEARLYAEAARLELNQLVAGAAAARPGPGGGGVPDLGRAMMARIQGAFGGPLGQQLGAGAQFQRDLLRGMNRAADGIKESNKVLDGIADGLRRVLAFQ